MKRTESNAVMALKIICTAYIVLSSILSISSLFIEGASQHSISIITVIMSVFSYFDGTIGIIFSIAAAIALAVLLSVLVMTKDKPFELIPIAMIIVSFGYYIFQNYPSDYEFKFGLIFELIGLTALIILFILKRKQQVKS